ncbi:hypothetical protein ONZ45_g5163 [Pleurotus djamor]|nr:hypothetical protein ONZ45_g5163 [Pleurotus djamor]
MAKAARQGEIVRQLTKSSHDTFECLKVFYEKLNRTEGCSNLQEGDLSRGGRDTDAVVVVGILLARTRSALGDAQAIVTQLLGIQRKIYKEMHKVDPSAMKLMDPWALAEQPNLSIENLRTMKDEDLLRLSFMVMEQFFHAIANFVNWWVTLEIDVGCLTTAIEFMLQNPNIASNMSAQQDYYDAALSDLMPRTLVKSWTVQITAVVTATWTIKDLSRRLPDASHLSAMTDSLKDGLSRALKFPSMSPSSPSYLLTLEQRIRFHGQEMVVALEHMSKQLQASAILCDFLSSRVASQNKVDKTGLPTLISDANDFRLCLTHLSSSLQLTAKNLNECIGVDDAPIEGLSQGMLPTQFRHAKNKVILSSSVPCKDFAGSGNVSQALQDTLEALYELSRFWEGHTLFLQAVVASGTRCSHEQLMKYTEPEQWKDAQRSCLSAAASIQELLGVPHPSSEPGNIPSDESIPPLESVPKEETGPSLDELVAEEHPSPENLRPRVNVNAKTVHIAFYAGDTFNGPMYAANVAGRANVTCAKN